MIIVREKQIDENTLGGRLRSARKTMRYTIEQAAELLGISDVYLAVIERNKRRPSLDLLIEMSLSYGASTDYLLFGSGGYPSINPPDENCRQFPLLHKLSEDQYETVMQIAALIRCKNLIKFHLDFLLQLVKQYADFITKSQN